MVLEKRWLKWLRYFFSGLLLYLVLVDLNVFYLFGPSPSISELRNPQLALASELYTCDSVLIGKYYKEKRSPVKLSEVAPVFIDALIATEDIRFYSHHGIDLKSALGGIFSTATGDKRGGSTLTQQLVKNLFRTRHTQSSGLLSKVPGIRTLAYKTKEWITSVKLEFNYSKTDILELYINTVGFGNNTYGIRVASITYFNKEPIHLTVEEACLLVGMLKATSTYNPISKPEAAVERRNIVIAQLGKYKSISPTQLDRLKQLPLLLDLSSKLKEEEQDSYLRSAAKESIENWCEENGYDIYRDGLQIYTTIDSKLQLLAEQAVNEKMREIQRRFNNHWEGRNPWVDEDRHEIKGFLQNYMQRTPVYKSLKKQFNNDTLSIDSCLNVRKRMKVFTWLGERDTTFSSYDSVRYYLTLMQTGLMTLNPFTRHIKAWVGGISHKYFKYDHVNQSKRQPGSTFKPFAYCTAIDKGYSPCDRFYDRPVHIRYLENGKNKVWSPQNSDWAFTGYYMSLRWAMAKSCNSVTAQLTEKVGWDNVVKYAHRCGIKSSLAKVPSICLGSSVVNLQEMVNAYGTFLADGLYAEPVLVNKIYDRDGRLLVEFKAQSKRVLDEETAWLMVWMLRGGMQEPGGTSQALWEYKLHWQKNEVGGKTGTSSNHSDGWYLGLTKDLITGVWVGADDPSIHFRVSELGEGSKTALPIYGRFMELVYQHPETGILPAKFPAPKNKIKRQYQCSSVTPKSVGDSIKILLSVPDSVVKSE
jgi:penicillin-binding protein 1A